MGPRGGNRQQRLGPLCRRISFAGGQHVFGDEELFVEPQEASDGAHKTTIKYATGQMIPLLIFEGFEEAVPNARGSAYFVERHPAHFTFPPEMFAKTSLGHFLRKNDSVSST